MDQTKRRRPPHPRSWRVFPPRDGGRIDAGLRAGVAPCCPWCTAVLEARPRSRLAARAPLDATVFDLDCRDCRRFWVVVRHTQRSLRLVRMRRLAAAVRAVEMANLPSASVA